jgi:hypothetical protein
MEKTKQLDVLPTLVECHFAIASLWMSKGAYDVFALVINFRQGLATKACNY